MERTFPVAKRSQTASSDGLLQEHRQKSAQRSSATKHINMLQSVCNAHTFLLGTLAPLCWLHGRPEPPHQLACTVQL